MLKIYKGFSENLGENTFRTMLIDRKRVFVDRLGWDLFCTKDGFEVDEYDTEDASYIVICEEDGRHAASMRVIPTNKPTMLFTHFPELCVDLNPDHRTWEVTRFMSATAFDSAKAAARLMWAGYRFAINAGVHRIVSVTGRKTALQMRACGSRPRTINSMEHEGEKISSCEWDIKNGFTEKLNRISDLSDSDVASYMIEITNYFKNIDIKFMEYKFKNLKEMEFSKSSKSCFCERHFDTIYDYT